MVVLKAAESRIEAVSASPAAVVAAIQEQLLCWMCLNQVMDICCAADLNSGPQALTPAAAANSASANRVYLCLPLPAASSAASSGGGGSDVTPPLPALAASVIAMAAASLEALSPRIERFRSLAQSDASVMPAVLDVQARIQTTITPALTGLLSTIESSVQWLLARGAVSPTLPQRAASGWSAYLPIARSVMTGLLDAADRITIALTRTNVCPSAAASAAADSKAISDWIRSCDASLLVIGKIWPAIIKLSATPNFIPSAAASGSAGSNDLSRAATIRLMTAFGAVTNAIAINLQNGGSGDSTALAITSERLTFYQKIARFVILQYRDIIKSNPSLFFLHSERKDDSGAAAPSILDCFVQSYVVSTGYYESTTTEAVVANGGADHKDVTAAKRVKPSSASDAQRQLQRACSASYEQLTATAFDLVIAAVFASGPATDGVSAAALRLRSLEGLTARAFGEGEAVAGLAFWLRVSDAAKSFAADVIGPFVDHVLPIVWKLVRSPE